MATTTTTTNNYRFNSNVLSAWIQTLKTNVSDIGNSRMLLLLFFFFSLVYYTSIDQCMDDELRQQIEKVFHFYSQKWKVDKDRLMTYFNHLLTRLSQVTLRDFILQQQQEKPYELSMEEWFLILQFYLPMTGSEPTILSSSVLF
jgi:hypothetical protein